MESDPTVVSLSSKRRTREQRSRKEYLDPETRIRELEEDMIRVIDIIAYLDDVVESNERLIRKLFRLLRGAADSGALLSHRPGRASAPD